MLVIGIAGGTGSGKTTVVRKIVELLPEGEVIVVPQDSYYKDNGHLPLEKRLEMNFDHPESIEFDLLVDHIKHLKEGYTVQQPIYSCTRAQETIPIEPRHIVIVEGILVFTSKELRDLMDIKIYVDADPDDRLSRVIARDIAERGRSVSKVLDRYDKTVKPMHLQFIEPTKRYADIIIPQGGNNEVAINVLKIFIEKTLRDHQNT